VSTERRTGRFGSTQTNGTENRILEIRKGRLRKSRRRGKLAMQEKGELGKLGAEKVQEIYRNLGLFN
jgi:hypothetical protein